MITNEEITLVFDEIANILELKGENRFKIRAYRNASRTIEGLTRDLVSISKKGELKSLPGIGEALAKKIDEIIKTGKIKYHEELKESIPSGLLEMLEVQGLGPKKTYKLHKELGIDSIESLERACKNNELHELFGMGKKTEENILRGIEQYRLHKGRISLGKALPYAESIVKSLKDIKDVKKAVFAGSLRRMRETVGDIDILVASMDSKPVMDVFTGLERVSEILACGETKSSIIFGDVQVDLRVVPPESFGAAMQYFTGSKQHNVRLRELAIRKGLKINEYGVFSKEKKIAGKTEEDVYRSVGLSYIPPELREDRGEISAALNCDLPKLVELSDIKGDLHIHTDWSDGKKSILEMSKAAKHRGYEYIAISDHSSSVGITGGLKKDRLEAQIGEIKKINKDLKEPNFRVLSSTEVDIKSDNTLDFHDDILSELDIVLAAVHTKFSQDKKSMTDRIISAINNPNVDIIAHPTGRLIGKREPYEVDVDRVIKAAKKTGVVLESNANPRRLDLNDMHCKHARENGVKIAISTDSHDSPHMNLMGFGIATARRGWIEKGDVLNTMPLYGLLDFLGID